LLKIGVNKDKRKCNYSAGMNYAKYCLCRYIKALLRNKLGKASDVILCDNNA